MIETTCRSRPIRVPPLLGLLSKSLERPTLLWLSARCIVPSGSRRRRGSGITYRVSSQVSREPESVGAFKDELSIDTVEQLESELTRASDGFPADRWITLAINGLEDLEIGTVGPEPTSITKSHTFKHVSIRTIHPGPHKIELQVNGTVVGQVLVEIGGS